MRFWSRVSCFGLGPALCGLVLAAPAQQGSVQPAASAKAAPAFTVTSREVLLDVVVTDASGHPVTGLTSADFAVKEGSTPQTLLSLTEHRGMSAGELARLKAVPVLPPNTFTNFTPVENTDARTVVLLDWQDTPMAAQMYAREELIATLKHMKPGAPIAIFELGAQFRMVQGFTSDPDVLLKAAESKRDMPAVRPPGYERYDNLHDALSMLSRYLSAFPGRKSLILFTSRPKLWPPFTGGYGGAYRDGYIEGFEHLFPDSDAVEPGNLQDFADVLTMSRVAVYPVDARGLQIDPQFGASVAGPPSTGETRDFLRRQVFDHSILDLIAEATGGKAFYDTNGLRQAMTQVIEESSDYYTLAYASTNERWDGGFRSVHVAVNRPGVRLQYRDGYYAYNREQKEQRQIARLEQDRSRMDSQPRNDGEPDGTASDEGGSASSAALKTAAEAMADDGTAAEAGALVRRSRRGFADDMGLGAVQPTEIVFAAGVQPEALVSKTAKQVPLPPDNFLRGPWQQKAFRNYDVVFSASAQRMKLTAGADGIRRGTVDFVAMVYDSQGVEVNALEKTARLELTAEEYKAALARGLAMREEIAIPTEGEYFLRLGVRDQGNSRVGALEIAADQIHLDSTDASAASQRSGP